MRHALMIVATLAAVAALSGCSVFQPKHDRSLDRKGESVELNLLTFDQLLTYSAHAGWREATDGELEKLRWKFDDDRDRESRVTYVYRVLLGPGKDTENTENSELAKLPQVDERAVGYEKRLRELFKYAIEDESAVLFAALAPIAIEWLFEKAKSVIEQQAALYESQYTAVAYGGGFWQKPAPQETHTPRYGGFEFLRWTNELPEEQGEPAMRLVVAFVPSPDDPRFFLLEPVFLQIQSSRAKVAGSSGKLSLRLHGSLEGFWITDKFESRQQDVATIDWFVDDIELSDISPRYFSRSSQRPDLPYVAGWFVGPPLSFTPDKDGKPVRLTAGTPVRLALVVTEKDKSNAKEQLEKLPGVLDTIKPKVDEAVGSITNPQ